MRDQSSKEFHRIKFLHLPRETLYFLQKKAEKEKITNKKVIDVALQFYFFEKENEAESEQTWDESLTPDGRIKEEHIDINVKESTRQGRPIADIQIPIKIYQLIKKRRMIENRKRPGRLKISIHDMLISAINFYLLKRKPEKEIVTIEIELRVFQHFNKLAKNESKKIEEVIASFLSQHTKAED